MEGRSSLRIWTQSGYRPWQDLTWERPLRVVTMQASMSHEVDGFGGGPWRMVPDAEGEMVEIEPPIFVLRESVHEAKRSSDPSSCQPCNLDETERASKPQTALPTT